MTEGVRMKLIIDIPASLYSNLRTIKENSIAGEKILDCVKNGIRLPEGLYPRTLRYLADEIETQGKEQTE